MADATSLSLICPQCGGQSSVEPSETKVKCRYCGNESLLIPPAHALQTQTESLNAPNERPQWSKPSSVKFRYEGGRIVLSYRWFSAKYFFLLFFCIFWDGFLFTWYGTALHGTHGGLGLAFLLFPMIHVAVGIGLSYTTIAGFFNTSELSLDRQAFHIKHFPLPWPGTRNIQATQLDQFFVAKTVSDKGQASYALNVLLKDGSRVKLLGGLESPEVGEYIEQQLEKWGHITDRRVAGEAFSE